jgi:flagellar hook-basal body complex protein FliE
MANIQALTAATQTQTTAGETPGSRRGSAAGPAVNFADTIREFLSAVNETQKEGAKKVAEVIRGESESLAEAMSALEEARLSFQLMLEIRNKLLESYQEIQRMQI